MCNKNYLMGGSGKATYFFCYILIIQHAVIKIKTLCHILGFLFCWTRSKVGFNGRCREQKKPLFIVLNYCNSNKVFWFVCRRRRSQRAAVLLGRMENFFIFLYFCCAFGVVVPFPFPFAFVVLFAFALPFPTDDKPPWTYQRHFYLYFVMFLTFL